MNHLRLYTKKEIEQKHSEMIAGRTCVKLQCSYSGNMFWRPVSSVLVSFAKAKEQGRTKIPVFETRDAYLSFIKDNPLSSFSPGNKKKRKTMTARPVVKEKKQAPLVEIVRHENFRPGRLYNPENAIDCLDLMGAVELVVHEQKLMRPHRKIIKSILEAGFSVDDIVRIHHQLHVNVWNGSKFIPVRTKKALEMVSDGYNPLSYNPLSCSENPCNEILLQSALPEKEGNDYLSREEIKHKLEAMRNMVNQALERL